MRHHGWELPYHPLQVVAIAVFFALGFAFYVFFAPFTGNKVLEFHIIAVYSPLAFLVLVLYILCAATNPADPGVLRSLRSLELKKKACPVNLSSSRAQQEINHQDLEQGEASEGELQIQVSAQGNKGGAQNLFWKVLCFPCTCFLVLLPGAELIESPCTRNHVLNERHIPEEDLVFCTLCKVEVCKYSKHCRACDKCVDGFDHHCRWLNNCVGRRNYKAFIALMVTGLLLLVLQWATGVAVFVRCFLHRNFFEAEIVRNLGSSFSWVPFIITVGLCTILAMIATLPLGQLFFFHMILIQKGISTYDYIIAIREQEQQAADREPSQVSSPSNSTATGVSGSSSLGFGLKGAHYTPPYFLKHQETSITGVELPSMSDGASYIPSASGLQKEERVKATKPKHQVKISPWKLAQLNALDASKAAARARENSSILHSVKRKRDLEGAADAVASCEEKLSMSYSASKQQIPISTSCGKDSDHAQLSKASSNKNVAGSLMDELASPPYQKETEASFKPDLSLSVQKMEMCSPERGGDSPDFQALVDGIPGTVHIQGIPNFVGASSSSLFPGPGLQRSAGDGYDASDGESADDSDHAKNSSRAWSKLGQTSSFNKSFLKSTKGRRSSFMLEETLPGDAGSSGMIPSASKSPMNILPQMFTSEILSSSSQSGSP